MSNHCSYQDIIDDQKAEREVHENVLRIYINPDHFVEFEHDEPSDLYKFSQWLRKKNTVVQAEVIPYAFNSSIEDVQAL